MISNHDIEKTLFLTMTFRDEFHFISNVTFNLYYLCTHSTKAVFIDDNFNALLQSRHPIKSADHSSLASGNSKMFLNFGTEIIWTRQVATELITITQAAGDNGSLSTGHVVVDIEDAVVSVNYVLHFDFRRQFRNN